MLAHKNTHTSWVTICAVQSTDTLYARCDQQNLARVTDHQSTTARCWQSKNRYQLDTVQGGPKK